jgi:hypothetical protein
MKKKFYELTFQVTETCNNGKERTLKKTVITAPFHWEKGILVHTSPEYSIPLAKEALEEQHYYNIKYISTKVTYITITDDFSTWHWYR